MHLLDSNIIIYSMQEGQSDLRKWFYGKTISASVISKIEVLGFHQISEFEKEKAEIYFNLCHIFHLTDAVVELAISLRQEKSMSLGDAIIASTALNYNLTLVTANDSDFRHIKGLLLINPLKIN